MSLVNEKQGPSLLGALPSNRPRYMHLSPAALDGAMGLLDDRGNSVATATLASGEA